MKILWLAPFPNISKSSHPAPWIVTLAKALVKHGIELTILNYSSKIEDEIVKKEFEGIHLIYVKVPKTKIDLLTLYKIRINTMKKYLNSIVDSYDLLHIHGSEHQYEVMAYELKIPILISTQGIITEVVKKTRMFPDWKIFLIWKLSSIYEKKYLPQYKYFSCRTHWDTNYIKSMNPNAKIYNIWEMIREDFFEDHFSNEKKNILFVGGKNPIKGLIELLHAYDKSLQDKGLRLIILGNCELNDVSEIISKYHLVNIDVENIDCRGVQNVKGMIKAYDESFCLVHPTYIDNSPNSVCEAQLSGLPVIATDVGGVASLIEDEETGLLIGRNSKEIEHAVVKLLDNNKLRNNISMNSRQVARERHNASFILNKTINLYDDMLK